MKDNDTCICRNTIDQINELIIISNNNAFDIKTLFDEITQLKKENLDLVKRIEILENHDPIKIIKY